MVLNYRAPEDDGKSMAGERIILPLKEYTLMANPRQRKMKSRLKR